MLPLPSWLRHRLRLVFPLPFVAKTAPFLVVPQDSNFILFLFMGVFGSMLCLVSFYGFLAALNESQNHLFKHAIMLSGMTVLGVILVLVRASFCIPRQLGPVFACGSAVA